MKISDLPKADSLDGVSFVAAGNGQNLKVDMNTLVAQMWDQMYIHSQKVIVPCKYCLAHNAISNSVCVECGAPMGDPNA